MLKIKRKKDIEGLFELRRFKKRPVEVLAVKMNEEFEVETLEGPMKGKKGYFLVFGVNGEPYPVKPSIFKQTYEEILD